MKLLVRSSTPGILFAPTLAIRVRTTYKMLRVSELTRAFQVSKRLHLIGAMTAVCVE